MALSKRLWDERAAVVVEFAIILPVLMMVVFAAIDLSRFFFTLSNLSASVREGARYGAVLAEPGSAPGMAEIRGRVKASFQPVGTDPLTDGDIDVAVDPAGFITVSVPSYDFDPLTPLAPSDITMPPRRAVFRWERAP